MVRALTPDTDHTLIRELQSAPPAIEPDFPLYERSTQFFQLLAFLDQPQVRAKFSLAVWRAFWLRNVEGVGLDETAGRLGVDPKDVLMANSRVLRYLREHAED